ncbi:chromosome transmission fidelity protein 18 homolog [Pectinophora gossypiella]|uniref:chromosome transmission fidelity protein 18 homolog n=1 Tax=Pectinophora gossypiella TaxID=13191 RepID=UPI00214E6262|nr:chromosome transmission fidelity protein 18 homolog [Pectinophora gossypiella]
MSDYPDPDEEYELMYADELELLQEQEDHSGGNVVRNKPFQAKRSLDFSSPITKKPPDIVQLDNSVSDDQISSTPALEPVEDLLTPENASLGNKRTVEDLFGDVGDIDFNELQLPSKKQKTEEENDLELIDRIIEGRKLRQLLLEPSSRLAADRPAYDPKENLSLDIPRWAFMPLTKPDGERIYVKLESEESWDSSLDIPPEQMSLRATYSSTWEEARKILEAKQQQATQPEEVIPQAEVDPETNLWVDKYRPESYLDLLSEEPVNRALLHWLHLWDKVVFKKEVKTKEPQQRTSFSKRTGQFQLFNKWRGKREAEPEVDEDGRPHHKVALLCGPPGVGKTTLAHLLARLAGYRPVELNASDERSTDAFRNALQSATLMRSVLDVDKRPNCLILDEIDGAPLPTVELLVKWCTATAADSKKKGKATAHPLRRPVIAICNDLYATSLRPLRPIALVVHVSGVSLPRLTSRLSHVCALSGLRVSTHVLAALAARAHPDVRAAIHLLSFFKARNKEQLTMEDVENAAIGTKDCSRTMMQALQAIFTIDNKNPDVMKIVQAAGEYDRLMDGIFENYLSARVDARLHIACETLSWLRLYDSVAAWTQRTQNYSLYGLLPMCALRCHSVLAQRAAPRVKFPTQAQEMYRKKMELESIVHSVWRGSTAAVTTTRTRLQLDILPLLPHLLAPHLRSANVQLCSESERRSLRTCAGAMCDYGLQYVQQRTPDGLYAFTLEPDVYKLAFFGNEERVRPPPAIRQALAREQQLEMIRRAEEMASRVTPRTTSEADKSKTTRKGADPKDTKETRIPNHLQRLNPKAIEKTPQVHKDFFGRIVPLSQVQRVDAVPDVISSSSVFYQYREGFNNAVRRNVRTKDML